MKFFLFFVLSWQWFNPVNSDKYVIHNQGWNEDGGNYVRFPLRAKDKVREKVWNLSLNSSGLTVNFYTNASTIMVRYQVTGRLELPHMPSTGVSGLDLFGIDDSEEWNRCWGERTFRDTITYSFHSDLSAENDKKGCEYRLYLPLYNEVKWLEIGVDKGYEFSFIPVSKKQKPIVAYGTSITQGACASTPSMAWASIVQRRLDMPLINLGFSGNGRLEKEVINYLCEIDGLIYILDCFQNLSRRSEQEIEKLLYDAVLQIREKRSSPIIITEHSGYSNSGSNKSVYDAYIKCNRAATSTFKKLQEEGVEDLYYISYEDLNFPTDGWVDSVHPSDLGMTAQADAVERKIREILAIKR